MDNLNNYFDDDVSDSWDRCAVIWAGNGRVEDLPHGTRRPWYTPCLGKRLGIEFSKRFYRETRFLIDKLKSVDLFEITCSFDLIQLVAWEYDALELALPKELLELNTPVPKLQYNEIKADSLLSEFSGKSVGEFLPFLIENA